MGVGVRRRWLSGRSGAVAVATVAVLVSAGASASVSGPASAVAEPPPPVSPGVRAAGAAEALVTDRPAALSAGPDDAFVRQPVQSSMGWQYVPYHRTYRGLPVLGGDFVVALTFSTVRHVPDVVGLSCSSARDWLDDVDLVGQCNGSGAVVTRQNPGAGNATTVGTVVQLSMGARPRPEPGCPDVGAAPNCP
jgi:hypothetical protein